MHAEDFVRYECRYGQPVEANSESLPHLKVVFSLALVVESVNTVDGATLVITPQEEQAVRVFDFVGQKHAN